MESEAKVDMNSFADGAISSSLQLLQYAGVLRRVQYTQRHGSLGDCHEMQASSAVG
jgi:hypothetical protein